MENKEIKNEEVKEEKKVTEETTQEATNETKTETKAETTEGVKTEETQDAKKETKLEAFKKNLTPKKIGIGLGVIAAMVAGSIIVLKSGHSSSND